MSRTAAPARAHKCSLTASFGCRAASCFPLSTWLHRRVTLIVVVDVLSLDYYVFLRKAEKYFPNADFTVIPPLQVEAMHSTIILINSRLTTHLGTRISTNPRVATAGLQRLLGLAGTSAHIHMHTAGAADQRTVHIILYVAKVKLQPHDDDDDDDDAAIAITYQIYSSIHSTTSYIVPHNR